MYFFVFFLASGFDWFCWISGSFFLIVYIYLIPTRDFVIVKTRGKKYFSFLCLSFSILIVFLISRLNFSKSKQKFTVKLLFFFFFSGNCVVI